jgi:5-methylcytosine-specific restriction protein A
MTIFIECPTIGCKELVEDAGICKKCAVKKKANPSGRKSDQVKAWMNSARYRNRRKAWIKGVLCVDCYEKGIRKPAQVLDHNTPHDGDYDLFWDESNWVGRCFSHHNQKTAREDGGFGNPKK